MFAGYDKELNVLEYTAEDVQSDWRKGLLLSIATLLTENGTAEGIKSGAWGALTGYVEDSLAAHFYEGKLVSVYATARGTMDCKIVRVSKLEEYGTSQYHHDSFGPGTETAETGISGIVTCEHGVTGRMSLEIGVGELIYTIANS